MFELREAPAAAPVPRATEASEFDALAALAHGTPAIAPRVSSRTQAPVGSPARPAPSAGAASKWADKSFLQKVGSVVVLVICLAVVGALKWNSMQRRDRAARRLGERLIDPGRSEETPKAKPPLVPPAPQERPVPAVLAPPPGFQYTQAKRHSVGTALVKDRRARGTSVELYLPPGTHANASLPCVFVCPAGSNCLVGVPFDDGERESFLPLVHSGVAVCFYSLDGTVKDLESAPDLLVGMAMRQYVEAEGGLRNLGDAIDTVLAGVPMIDPARLGVCGHSSAGTIALMGAAREPRIAAGAVMAPVIDLPKRLGQDVIDSLPGPETRFVLKGSPASIEQLERPVLLIQARDDDNTPADEAQSFAAKHASAVTLRMIESGGHGGAFTQGCEPAFAFLAEKLRAGASGASTVTRRTAGSGEPTPPSDAVPF